MIGLSCIIGESGEPPPRSMTRSLVQVQRPSASHPAKRTPHQTRVSVPGPQVQHEKATSARATRARAGSTHACVRVRANAGANATHAHPRSLCGMPGTRRAATFLGAYVRQAGRLVAAPTVLRAGDGRERRAILVVRRADHLRKNDTQCSKFNVWVGTPKLTAR